MLTNISTLILMLIIRDKRDLLSGIIVCFFFSITLIQLYDSKFEIDLNVWYFTNTFIDLSITTTLILCYHKMRNKLIIFYTSLVVGVYVIPDIIQFYGFTLNYYDQITALTCLIEIIIVGRQYGIRLVSGYNGCIKRWWSHLTNSD